MVASGKRTYKYNVYAKHSTFSLYCCVLKDKFQNFNCRMAFHQEKQSNLALNALNWIAGFNDGGTQP